MHLLNRLFLHRLSKICRDKWMSHGAPNLYTARWNSSLPTVMHYKLKRIVNLPVHKDSFTRRQRCADKEIHLVLQLMYLFCVFLQFIIYPLLHITKVRIECITAKQIIFQHTICPLAKTRSISAIYPVTDRQNCIQIIKHRAVLLPICCSIFQNGNNWILI